MFYMYNANDNTILSNSNYCYRLYERWALSRIFIDLTQTQPEMTPDLTPLEEKDSWIF